MAQFEMQLPESIINDIKKIYKESDKIFGEMTTAGAKVVEVNIKTNVPKSFLNSEIMNCLEITRVYKTPSDDGINTKVAFYGYFKNHRGKITPAPLVANVFEYGTSKIAKQPFLRKSFRKAQIEKAMLEAQKKASGGLLQ